VRVKQVCETEGYWHHTIHLELPQIPDGGIPEVPDERSATCNISCLPLKGLLRGTQRMVTSMQESVSRMIDRINQQIPDIDVDPRDGLRPSRRRATRGLLDFIGSASSYFFGTATESEISELRDSIRKIEAMADTAAADASRTRDGLAEFTKLQNERTDSLSNVLREQHRMLETIYREVRTGSDASSMGYAAISYMTTELTRYMAIHDNILLLELGLEDLVHGQLTPRLVEVGMLDEVLRNASQTMYYKGFELCPAIAKDVYIASNFDFARKGNNLYIQLRLPYARLGRRRVDVYKLYVFPVPVPGTEGLTTELKDMPPYLLGNPNDVRVGELLDEPRQPVVRSRTVRWHLHTQKTCLWAIAKDDPDLVHKECDFATRRQIVEPTYLELTPGTYVVSNLTDMHAACPTYRKPLTAEACAPCMLKIGCGCSISARETTLVAKQTLRDCGTFLSHVEARYAVNLAVLKSFYDMTSFNLTGRTLWAAGQTPEQQPLELKFFEDAANRYWAADETASYSLKKLADSLKNQTVILHTPAEAVVHDMLSRNVMFTTSAWSQWTTWLSLLPWAAVVFLVIWQCIIHRRMSTLMIAAPAAMCVGLPKTKAFVLLTPPPTTTMSPLEWLAMQAQIRLLDFAFTVLALLLIVTIIALSCAVRKAHIRRSFVFIDIIAGINVVQLHYFTLPDATRNYEVRVSKRPAKLTLRSFCLFGELMFTPKPWRLIHLKTQAKLPLPSFMLIPFWKIRRVANALNTPGHTVTPLVVHTHEYMYNTVKTRPVSAGPPGYAESRM
jgi:hypothetical protein